MQEYTLKKSLGQHFLKDENICKKIADALQSHSFKQLLEVGPGAGALTKYLLDIKDIDFKAVELDEEKVIFLEKQFPAIKGRIIHKSVLDIDAPFEKDFTVIGNFPYNISSQILFKILDWKERVPLSIGMFQKEVAQRIAAKSGSKAYGILSVLIQEFYDVTYLFDVPPESFNPPPKVMSGVIQLIKKENTFALQSERKFFVLVKTAFKDRKSVV